MAQKLYGGIEFGGSKTVCAIGDATGTISAQTTIPTTSVDATLAAVFEFFAQNVPITSLGVGSFGPLQLDPAAPEFGYIHNAPKPGWANVALKPILENRLRIAVNIDTDVNCAALGEQYYGVAKQARSFIYLTLGTGIGGSLVVGGQLVYGLSHLEMGHARVPHEPLLESFKGACPFHGDCLEGLASGYAMEQRYGKKSEQIVDSDAWEREAGYIASMVTNLMLTTGPEMIILGGGLTNHPGLIEAVRQSVRQNINDYVTFPDLDRYIVKSSGSTNGALGAIKLAALSN